MFTNVTKRIYPEVNSTKRVRIRKLILGKTTDTEAKLETNTPFVNKPLVSSFISYFSVQEKGWL